MIYLDRMSQTYTNVKKVATVEALINEIWQVKIIAAA